MTREEAIEKLELMRQKVDEETYRALILAIKALENHDEFMKRSYEQGKVDALSHTQKSGKWIMSDDGLYRPICDKCGAHPWKGYIPSVEEATEVFKYCPNCGAKMESESDA